MLSFSEKLVKMKLALVFFHSRTTGYVTLILIVALSVKILSVLILKLVKQDFLKQVRIRNV